MKTLEEKDQKAGEAVEGQNNLILYNDEINTFEHVIDCLVSLCNQTEVQAEQCAYITHNNGRCAIKKGNYKSLAPIQSALQLQGLTVEII